MHQTSSDQLSNTFRFAFYTVIIISFRNSIQNLKMNQVMITRHFLLPYETINYMEVLKNYNK